MPYCSDLCLAELVPLFLEEGENDARVERERLEKEGGGGLARGTNGDSRWYETTRVQRTHSELEAFNAREWRITAEWGQKSTVK